MSVLRFAAFLCLFLVGGAAAWADDSSLSLPQVAVVAVEYLNGLHAQFGTPDAAKNAAALKEAVAKQGRNDAAGAVARYERAVALGDEQTDTLMALRQALTRVNRGRDSASAAWLDY